jgi:hypothetical protein
VPYAFAPAVLPPLDLLPAAERRRTVPTVKIALVIAQAAMTASGRDPKDVATVFASSGGDGETIEAILETLTTEAREVSPTRFHNSVHNAPAGYWAIATGCRAPSVSLCAHDFTFAAALLEAALQASSGARPVGLNVYDAPYPSALGLARPILGTFGVGLVLAPERSAKALAALRLTLDASSAPYSKMADPELERLRQGNPAARSLPLLAALAQNEKARLVFESAGADALCVEIEPVGP